MHLNSNLKRYTANLSQDCESDFIHRNTSEIQMNSKAEWHQPAVPRVVVTRDLEEVGGAGQRGRGRGRQQAGGRRQRGGA